MNKFINNNNKTYIFILLILIFAFLNFLVPFLKILDYGNIEIEILSDLFSELLDNPVYEGFLGDVPDSYIYPLHYDSHVIIEPSLPNEFFWKLFDLWGYIFILNTIMGIAFLLIEPVLELTGHKFETNFPFVTAGFLLSLISVIVEYGLIFLVIITGNTSNEFFKYTYTINYIYLVLFVLGTGALIIGYLLYSNKLQMFSDTSIEK